jgi:hypothetical protein
MDLALTHRDRSSLRTTDKNGKGIGSDQLSKTVSSHERTVRAMIKVPFKPFDLTNVEKIGQNLGALKQVYYAFGQ